MSQAKNQFPRHFVIHVEDVEIQKQHCCSVELASPSIMFKEKCKIKLLFYSTIVWLLIYLHIHIKRQIPTFLFLFSVFPFTILCIKDQFGITSHFG